MQLTIQIVLLFQQLFLLKNIRFILFTEHTLLFETFCSLLNLVSMRSQSRSFFYSRRITTSHLALSQTLFPDLFYLAQKSKFQQRITPRMGSCDPLSACSEMPGTGTIKTITFVLGSFNFCTKSL